MRSSLCGLAGAVRFGLVVGAGLLAVGLAGQAALAGGERRQDERPRATVVVTNEWPRIAVLYVHVVPAERPVEETDWGNNFLGDGGVIPAGESFRVVNIPVGTYHVRAIDADGDTYTWANLPVEGEVDLRVNAETLDL